MTEWINVGVYHYTEQGEGEHRADRVKTKKHLRELVATQPGRLAFDVTDAFGARADTFVALKDMREGQALQVTGPDPYTSRKWYATVKRQGDGFKVS